MEKYKFEGYYIDNNKREDLIGEIEVTPDGTFEGKITNLEQIIKGHLVNENSFIRLIFLKIDNGNNHSNMVYELSKSTENAFEGKYSGLWGLLPIMVHYNKDLDIFMEEICSCIAKGGGSTEISFYKI